MGVKVQIRSYDTPTELYDAFARVLGEGVSEDGGTRWVEFETADVEVTLFAPREAKIAAVSEEQPA